jgi:hypothetical protein
VLLTTGCVNIGAEMVAIFTFQALYGYIYLQTRGAGDRVSGRPAARCLGGGAFCRQPASGVDGRRPAALPAADDVCPDPGRLPTDRSRWGVIRFRSGGLLLLRIPVSVGPLVSGDSSAAAAQSFSADLVGAAIGVLLVSLLLIPFLGLLWATLCLAGIKLISVVIAGTIHDTA